MQEVIISENVKQIVNAKEIIDSISGINDRYEQSKKLASGLINSINESSKSLQKAKDDNSISRNVFGWSSETLLSFIIESNNATHTSVSSISKLIENNNENSKLLAEMLGKLAMLSGLSFEKISETTAQLEEMALNFEQNSSGNTKQGGQIKQVILAHLNKIREEKNKEDRIEFNFGVVNENIKDLNDKIKTLNIENEKRIALIQKQLNSKSEKHFIDVQNKQSKIINFLGVFSSVTFLIILSFLIYYFYFI